MSWVNKLLSEIGDIKTGGTPKTSIKKYYGDDYLFVTPSDLNFNNYYIYETERGISKFGKENYASKFIPPFSIIYTCIGNTTGKIALNKSECMTNQQINSVIPYKDYDYRFIYYYLINITPYIKKIGGGAATPIVNKKTFGNIEISIPTFQTQKRIADILSAHDDLIENNLKRIKLLEQAAQNIYKEWFVKMRFPGHENTPTDHETGLPDNWKKDKIDNILKLIHGFAFKAKDFVIEPTNIMVIRMGNFNENGDLQLDKNVKYLPSGTEIKKKYKLFAGDLLMVLSDVTRDGRIIGNVGILPQKEITYALNQRVAHLKLHEPKLKYYFLYSLNSYNFKEYCKSRANGATVLNLKTKDILNYEITIPPKKLVDLFLNQITPINQLKENLLSEIEKLKSARDILLPRLMNQTIEV